MASGRGGGQTPPALSERQRDWLKHLRTAEGQGEPLRHYAKRLGLSEHSLYEAKRRFRELGVIAPAAARRPITAGSAGSARFARVAVPEGSVASGSPLRVRLASGAVLEWSEAPRGEALRELVGVLSG
jgi:hypothetical protein